MPFVKALKAFVVAGASSLCKICCSANRDDAASDASSMSAPRNRPDVWTSPFSRPYSSLASSIAASSAISLRFCTAFAAYRFMQRAALSKRCSAVPRLNIRAFLDCLQAGAPLRLASSRARGRPKNGASVLDTLRFRPGQAACKSKLVFQGLRQGFGLSGSHLSCRRYQFLQRATCSSRKTAQACLPLQ